MAEPDEPPRIDVRSQSDSRRLCPFCRDALRTDEAEVACPACDTRHHRACWSEAGRCATCGVGAGPERRRPGDGPAAALPPPPVRPRPTRGSAEPTRLDADRRATGAWGLLLAMCAALALAVVGAVALRARSLPATGPSSVVPTPSAHLRARRLPTIDLRDDVQVGARYTFTDGHGGTTVWTVTAVEPRTVRYTAELSLAGLPSSSAQEWTWDVDGTDVMVMDGERLETLQLGDVALPCRVQQLGAVTTWTAIQAGSDGIHTFPGIVRWRGGPRSFVHELTRIDLPTPAGR